MSETPLLDPWDQLPIGDKAIIVGVHLPQSSSPFVEDLEELKALLKTLGVEVRDQVVQNRQKLNPACLIGRGKALELKDLVAQKGANMVVFDRPLSPPQMRNLEKLIGVAILDRTGVILEIFSHHARTSMAKTQVEIARLEYLLPRMTGAWTHFGRQTGGGVRSRGMGETQIEVDRRRARERMSRLRQKLSHFDKEGRTRRKARAQEWKVALVGYTNSGKTTLMRMLTRSQNREENALFATLDTNIKVLDPSTRPKVLITDTVGFIRNLPHKLIESFKSTLQEVLEADVLVHVVDVSHENYREQMKTTEQVLKDLGADHLPVLYVFNKVDALDDMILPRILMSCYKNAMVISAHRPSDIEQLREFVVEFFARNLKHARLLVKATDHATMATIHSHCLILESDYSQEDTVLFHLQATEAMLAKLKDHVIPDHAQLAEQT